MAKVGETASKNIGNQRAFFVHQVGDLYFKMADEECCYDDNAGEGEVQIGVQHDVPPPVPFKGKFTLG